MPRAGNTEKTTKVGEPLPVIEEYDDDAVALEPAPAKAKGKAVEKSTGYKKQEGQEFVITQAPVQQRYLKGQWQAVARVEGTKRPTRKFEAVANSEKGAWEDLHEQLVAAGFDEPAATDKGGFTELPSYDYNGRFYPDA